MHIWWHRSRNIPPPAATRSAVRAARPEGRLPADSLLCLNMRHANEVVPETILDLAAEFLNKLAGCDFGKLLNIMVLQKRASAKSHEKTWELAVRFSVVNPCNSLIFNE